MDNDYIGKDKLYHFLVCLFIALYSTEGALCAGLAKEYSDYKNYGHWCWWDLLFDTIGTLLGTLIRVILIHRYNWF